MYRYLSADSRRESFQIAMSLFALGVLETIHIFLPSVVYRECSRVRSTKGIRPTTYRKVSPRSIARTLNLAWIPREEFAANDDTGRGIPRPGIIL